jgi:hypothetical protein
LPAVRRGENRFSENNIYVPPVWPDEPATQQQMAHLDFTARNAE